MSAVDQGFIEGKVVKVTPEGADVQATGQGIIHFNRNGYLPFGGIYDPKYWCIDGLPFAERRVMLERGRQRTMVVGQKDQKVCPMAVGQKVWMQSGDQFKEATVIELTECYIEVEPADLWQNKRYSLRFHISHLNWLNGKQAGMFLYLGDKLGWAEDDRRPLCTEFGPWELALYFNNATPASLGGQS